MEMAGEFSAISYIWTFKSKMNQGALLPRYNHSIPRYTSYPTVPQWQPWNGQEVWTEHLRVVGVTPQDGIAIYIHLPYCEHLCTYCGCNKKITTNHAVEKPYMARLLKEWQLYVGALGADEIRIRELHLGGGTPTFFAPEALKQLIEGIFALASAHPQLEMSFEGHPNNTTLEHLKVLRELGFQRVSFGVQDLDPEVQRLINRIQPLEKLVEATLHARNLGYQSVNYDLIYGLPLQNASKLLKTLEEVIRLRPDRVAFYGYAHVPWKSRAQRLYDESHLPDASTRLELYQMGRNYFREHGYDEVGMDHFALPNDDLAITVREGRLHRNFMGYTTSNARILIGLGVSSISDLGGAFAQNSKELVNWERAVDDGVFAVDKGIVLSEDDSKRRALIEQMSCQGYVEVPTDWEFEMHQKGLLEQMLFDGLLERQGNMLRLTQGAQPFTRHACSLFDAYLAASPMRSEKQFSQAV